MLDRIKYYHSLLFEVDWPIGADGVGIEDARRAVQQTMVRVRIGCFFTSLSFDYCSSRSIVSGRSRAGRIEVGTCDVRVAAVEHVASTGQPILRFLLSWILWCRTGQNWIVLFVISRIDFNKSDPGNYVEVLCST